MADNPHTNKAARNKRKKENAKKSKQDAAAKLREDEDLLAAAAALAAKEALEHKRFKHLRDLAGRSLPFFLYLGVSTNQSTASHSIQIKPSPIRGLGLFALKPFAAGVAILREASLLPIVKTNSWLLKETSFNLSPPDKQAVFSPLHSHCVCKPPPCFETPFMRIWNDNSFSLPQVNYTCVYEVASRLNHSCIPNATVGFTPNDVMVVRTSRDIKEGEEITIQYTGYKGGNKKSRRAVLQKKYGFICRCNSCLSKQDLPIILQPLEPINEPYNATAKVLNERNMASLTASRNIVAWANHMIELMPDAEEMFMDRWEDDVARETILGGPYEEFNDDLLESALEGWMYLLKHKNIFRLSPEVINKHIYRFEERFGTQIGKKDPLEFIGWMAQILREDFEIEDVWSFDSEL